MLPPIPGLEFHEENHRYRYQGRWLTWSVSKIASPLDRRSQAYINSTKHIWEPRGNTVHRALEAILKGEQIVDAGEYGQWVNAMQQSWLLQGCEVIASEYSVCDPKRSIGGQLDFILKTAKGTKVLGDLKTVGDVEKVRTRKPATAQGGGYLEMLQRFHDLWIDKVVTFVVGPGATRVIAEDPDVAVEAWQAARGVWEKGMAF
jgi:hypothetical protein